MSSLEERLNAINARLNSRMEDLNRRIAERLGGTSSSTPSPAKSAVTRASSGTRYGLYVGIDHYSVPANTLGGCIVDAGNMASVCRDLGGWSDSNQALLTDASATLSAIRSALHSLAEKAKAGDVVLYFHSSHGGPNSAGNASSNDTTLLTHDGNYEEAVLREDLCRFRKGVNLIVIVDACYSGGLIRGPAPNGGFPAVGAASERIDAMIQRFYQALLSAPSGEDGRLSADDIGWITAVDNGQSAVDCGSEGGLFTSRLLVRKGWREGQADRIARGFVTFLDLAEYVRSASQSLDPDLCPQYHNPGLLRSIVAGRVGP